MGYSLYLFAHDGQAFAELLQRSPEKVLRKVEAWAQRQRYIRGRELERGLKYVRELCSGEFGKVQRTGHFDALCWMGMALMEWIRLPEFLDHKHTGFIVECGIMPGFLEHPAPYRLPVAKESPPEAGYLPWTAMASYRFVDVDPLQQELMELLCDQADALFSELGRQLTGKEIEPPDRRNPAQAEIAYAREQFRYVLETLRDDKLDLLAVIG
jgi:hypothetical protein